MYYTSTHFWYIYLLSVGTIPSQPDEHFRFKSNDSVDLSLVFTGEVWRVFFLASEASIYIQNTYVLNKYTLYAIFFSDFFFGTYFFLAVASTFFFAI